MTALPLTGERTVPGIPEENYWFRRHQAAYAFLAPLVADRTVLEVGCGEGYGTHALASWARHVVGLDYDGATLAHAARTYPRAGYLRANLAALPMRSGVVDAVVTLQVIEHVWDHGEFLRECLRVVRPGGVLMVTTPNRLTFSAGRDTPVNVFHTKEFTASELVGMLTYCGFTVTRTLGLFAGARLRALDTRHGGSFVDAQLGTAPGSWPDGLRRDVASVAAGDFSVRPAGPAELDESLDLVVVATRPSAAT